MTSPDQSRRDFVKRGAYVAPVILTLAAAPAFAKSGSAKPDNRRKPGKDKPGKGRGKGRD